MFCHGDWLFRFVHSFRQDPCFALFQLVILFVIINLLPIILQSLQEK